MGLVEEAKKRILDLETVTGNIEALEMVKGRVSVVNDSGTFILDAVLTTDHAESIDEFVKKIIDDEKRQNEERLSKLMGIFPPDTLDISEQQPSETNNEVTMEFEEIKQQIRDGESLDHIGKQYGKSKKEMYEYLAKNNTSVTKIRKGTP